MAEPGRRRRRPAVSCSLCRRRKLRCNRENPCGNCMKARNATCVYENHSPPPQPRPTQPSLVQTLSGLTPSETASSTSRLSNISSHVPGSSVAYSTTALSPASPSSTHDVELMRIRIRELEEQLSKATSSKSSPQSHASPLNSEIETAASQMGGTYYFHRESNVFGPPQGLTRSVTHKSRFFGQSHWIVGMSLFKDLLGSVEPLVREGLYEAFTGMQKCKSLARIIKSQRAPPWPSPPTADLPRVDIANELVNCYLRTTETVHRILHIPTFIRDYEALWTSEAKPSTAFLVQLKLVFALGAATYDDNFSLRSSAVRWVYEALTWISEPEFKSRIGIQFLQIDILLLIARETIGVGRDSVWVSAGELLRRGMIMGLHRDPSRLPNKSTFVSEMRRRLWNTIVELALQSSLTTGGAPLISLYDFDTQPPANFDDEQLTTDSPVPGLENHFTQTSIAIALHKTFPARLAVAKFLNDISSHGSYEELLRLDADLRASYRVLTRTLHGYESGSEPSPSQFSTRMVHFIMHQYVSALHKPYFGPALRQTAYAFSRKVVVETSLKIWYAVYPASSFTGSRSGNAAFSSDHDDFARLAVCGSGFCRTVALQATLLIACELRTQLQEDEGLGPVTLRPDLLSVIEDVKTWCVRCIEAGETNIKAYLLGCVIAAQVQGLMRGLGADEIPQLLAKAATEAGDTSLSILERIAAQGQANGALDTLPPISLDTPSDGLGDWDLTMADALFNPGNTESLSWAFNDEAMQEVASWW
ncbi:hypothetical protein P170DRAFT_455805 [Aspergillus steynii IBT 23096]|uniref:Zn(2)-C6 fungal-type domain-containing protein n=1 Tax=Aspergillus steynii IBT 23096 TaxID=1392250 RepID=A0A2I2G7Z9_9EURO|nr:uncharacterized protein P170DRAFT_455805 [Aspergillus steynii IBT 23096]PLB49012.1 hypothetical protein P170DRAFT_455805 [Aspergillus steynii IBT 23096]